MTIRDVLTICGVDDDPIGTLMMVVRILRSIVQKEPATFEGECESVLTFLNTPKYGAVNPQTVQAFVGNLGNLADHELPDSFVKWVFAEEVSDDH